MISSASMLKPNIHKKNLIGLSSAKKPDIPIRLITVNVMGNMIISNLIPTALSILPDSKLFMTRFNAFAIEKNKPKKNAKSSNS